MVKDTRGVRNFACDVLVITYLSSWSTGEASKPSGRKLPSCTTSAAVHGPRKRRTRLRLESGALFVFLFHTLDGVNIHYLHKEQLFVFCLTEACLVYWHLYNSVSFACGSQKVVVLPDFPGFWQQWTCSIRIYYVAEDSPRSKYFSHTK
jgi:hypothetical protein